jgi:tetratricopeptide (TPR) repeat protein
MAQARYRDAEPVLRRATALSEEAYGAEAPQLAKALTQLAICCKALARFSDAGPLFQRALTIVERVEGREGSEVAAMYREFAALEHAAGNWARGVPFARTAVQLRRRALGGRHPMVASDLIGLAALLEGQKEHREAERLYMRAIAILERADPDHPDIAVALNNLAAIQQGRRRVTQAEGLYRRALALHTAHVGPGHPLVALCANNLAVLLSASKRQEEAAVLFRSALSTFRRTYGPGSLNVAGCLENYAVALRALGRRREAEACRRRARRIMNRIEALNDDGVAATATINARLARFHLIVRRSPIDRLGVFAVEPIPARRRVIIYTGERIGRREAMRRSSRACSYLFAVTGGWLDGAIGGSGAEYVNHSCAPNLRARKIRNRIVYVSRRAIAEGEELTIDYAYPADVEPVRCHCGAPGCRGTINRVRRRAPETASRRRADRGRR